MFFIFCGYIVTLLIFITFGIYLLQLAYFPNLNYRFLWNCFSIYIQLKRRTFLFKHEEILILPSFEEVQLEKPKEWKSNQKNTIDSIVICGTDCKGISLLAEVVRGSHGTAIVHLMLKYKSNTYYTEGSKVHACNKWVTDTLGMEQLEPMRRWRLVYNGRLRNKDDDDLKHIRINFIWSALGAPYIYKRDVDPWLVAKDLAKTDASNYRDLLIELGSGYEQWGVLNGRVNIEGNETTNIHLNSIRQHSWSDGDFKPRQSIVAFVEDDTMISINLTQGKISTQYGQIRKSSGNVSKFVASCFQPVSSIEKHVITFSDNRNSQNTLTYECQKTMMWNNKLSILKGSFNSLLVHGFVQSYSGVVNDVPGLSLLHEDVTISSALVLPLESSECSNSHLVGGKALSLALLNQATSGVLQNKAIVPKGFCLTVNAMKLQLESSDLIKTVLEDLELALSSKESVNLQEHCKNVVTSWQRIPVCEELSIEVSKRIEPHQTYAVRSSGVGEDSETLSAAGQNATILGCLGVDGVLYGIKECWASLYTFQSVEYRRQHGMPVDSGMGVIVQEMVPADTAGVMFTRHPTTGDPGQVYVTANFGLGETVVSGAAEPDTFIVNRLDSLNLQIESVIKGGKSQKLCMKENGNLVTEYIQQREELCLSNSDLIRIVKVGITLEDMFGWPRDIEWALYDRKIYLLQCRPITSLFAWTDQELTHELDSALLNDVFTTANAGEVYPGATSPLTQSVPIRIINKLMIKEDRNSPSLWYNNDILCTSHHHAIINCLTTIFRYIKPKTTLSQKVLELAVCGHPVSNNQLLKKAARKNGHLTLWKNFSLIFSNLMDMIWNASVVKSAEILGNTFKLNITSCTSAASLIDLITSNIVYFQEVVIYHSHASSVSVFWQMVLLSVLTEGNADLSSTHLEDVSQLLLSSANVVSAEIPTVLKEISTIILQCLNYEEFCKIPQNETEEWLKYNCPAAFNLLENLLLKHGHRCIKEMDLKTETWGLNPNPLIATLQSLVKKPIKNTKSSNIQNQVNVVDLLKSPKKNITRILLKWIQPWSRTAAERREITKNALLLILHQFRLAYRELGVMMLQEGRLPETDILFYFTHYELMTFITTQDPTILQKAARRKRHWLKWNQLQFPEIIDGFPIPNNINLPKFGEATKVKGTLVFPGRTQGRACILSLGDDTTQICHGDILITHSTDVGWSPLYPLLSGVVTELGGLISHGAVVAREYGLPCIVGAAEATKVFQTGDEVLLDANNGVIVKLTSNENSMPL